MRYKIVTDKYGAELLGTLYPNMAEMEAAILHTGNELPPDGLKEYHHWHEVLECDDCGIHGTFNGGSSYVDLSVRRAQDAHKQRKGA